MADPKSRKAVGAAATLVVSCPDQTGIVASLGQLLYSQGANINQSDQYSDTRSGMFFQRLCFEFPASVNSLAPIRSEIAELAARCEMRWKLHPPTELPKVAIMVSRLDHCLYDLLLRHRSGELPCEIALVVSNHPEIQPIAEHFGFPFHVFPISKANKAEQEAKELALFNGIGVDLIVLARYMQILSGDFIRHYESRIINIHHSFLPAFMGAKPYEQAYERGVKLIGATAHYATEELDQGPIIAQGVAPISHQDQVGDLARRGRDLERMVLGDAVRLHLEHRVLVHGNKTVVFD